VIVAVSAEVDRELSNGRVDWNREWVGFELAALCSNTNLDQRFLCKSFYDERFPVVADSKDRAPSVLCG
jgi:hypothetical protein